MNLIIRITVFVFFSLNVALGQTPESYYLLDGESKEAVIYANIGVMNTKSGTVSDAEGRFSISDFSSDGIIVISALGYESLTLNLADFGDEQEILLKPFTYEIEELVISSKSMNQQVLLGERNEDGRGHSFGFGSAQLGTELGVAIEIDAQTKVESVNFVLNHAKGDSLLFRINIYDYSTGKIGDKLLKQNIYIKDKQRKGNFSVDLSEYNIMLSDDVLVSIEWLRDFDELGNKTITFDTKKTKSLKGTFIRYSSQSDFYTLDYKKSYKPCIYLIGKQSED